MGQPDIVRHLESLTLQHGKRIAAKDKEHVITYQELDQLSDNLALRLLAADTLPGDRVVLAIDRSIYALVGIVAVLKAGLAYIPQEWNGQDEFSVDHVPGLQQSLFITRASFSGALKQQRRRVILIDAPTSVATSSQAMPATNNDALLYTIFTSGSTGVSKGVDISRSNVMHYQQALSHLLGINEPLNYAYVSSLSADLGNTGIFLSLFNGGTLHLIDDATRRDANRFQRYLSEQRIDILKITPSHFTSLCERSYATWQLKWIIFGGEPLPVELARSVLRKGQAIHVANHYGPTETTIGVACYPMLTLEDVPASGSVPVGLPIGDTLFELIDEQGEILPTERNVQGELVIGGPGVGQGYYNDTALTEQKFSPLAGNAHAGRFYASGDIFRRTDQGAYYFVGRKDRQVKVRGFRVDLDAIESEILRHCAVSAAAVLTLEISGGSHIQLVAAIVPAQHVPSSSSEVLREAQKNLRRVLPGHMIPARILMFDTLPLSSNGKVDLEALRAAFDQSSNATSTSIDLATIDANPERVALAHQLWMRYTGSMPASVEEDFYAVGGDSILAIQLLSALQNENINLNPSVFYANPTFAGLVASWCSTPVNANVATATTSERHLSPIQRWFFDQYPEGPNHWAQTVLLDCEKPIDRVAMQVSVKQLMQAYPILLTQFTRNSGSWVASDAATNAPENFSDRYLNPKESVSRVIVEAASNLQLSTGHLFHVLLLRQQGQPDRLAIICHHLVVDGVSWRILLDDLMRLYSSVVRGSPRRLATDPHSYWSWSKRLMEWAETLPAATHHGVREISPGLPSNFNTGPNIEGASAVFWLGYDKASTQLILHDLPHHLGVSLQTILLTCFLRGVAGTFGGGRISIPVDIETHGRHLFAQEMEVNRAVGWFTSLSPWLLEVRQHESLQASAVRIGDCLEGLEHKGIEYAARHYLAHPTVAPSPTPELCFNYLGQFTLPEESGLGWSWSNEYPGAARAPSSQRIYQLKFTGRIVNGQLAIDLSYNTHRHARTTIRKLLDAIEHELSSAITAVAPALTKPATRRDFSEESSTGLLTYIPAALRQDGAFAAENRPKNVLLTGATGFIGIYLLRELLAQETLEVHCLVRSKDDQPAETRLWEQFRWYFPDDAIENVRKRVFVHDGDITAHHLNLNEQWYTLLSSRIDTVFHSAADVRLFAPLDELRLTNVEGTRNLIEFCQCGRSKRLHFVSTLSVAGVNPRPGESVFSEDDLTCGQSFLTPYERSKYEAEQVVRQFIFSGGKACIHRTGSVSADAVGTFQMNIDSNRVMQTICTYILAGVVPEREEDLLLCPVDSLVRSMVSLATSALPATSTFHLTPPRRFMHDELVPILRNIGFNVRLDSEATYLEALKRLENSHPREVTLGRLWAARISRGIHVDASRTHQYLQLLGTAIPPVDEYWFARFLNRCIERGYLPNEEMMLQHRS
ncbi:thioester reductase domain-containing protein [Erwiniaceae bacterium L1_54_6]|nr:thioester reductase domain-containing protein [Erwiniaceae bacterium L1_54_6]